MVRNDLQEVIFYKKFKTNEDTLETFSSSNQLNNFPDVFQKIQKRDEKMYVLAILLAKIQLVMPGKHMYTRS